MRPKLKLGSTRAIEARLYKKSKELAIELANICDMSASMAERHQAFWRANTRFKRIKVCLDELRR